MTYASILEINLSVGASSTHQPHIADNILREAAYVDKGGEVKPGKIAGNQALYKFHSTTVHAYSHNTLNAAAARQARHLIALRVIGCHQNSGTPPTTPVGSFRSSSSSCLRPTQAHAGAKLNALANSLNSDKQFKKAFYSYDNYAANRHMFKNAMLNEDAKTKTQKVAKALIWAGCKLSSVGDMINAVTTSTINAICNFIHPSKDTESLGHCVARLLCTVPALIILAGSAVALKCMVSLCSEGADDEGNIGETKLKDFVGWYWYLFPFHLVGGLFQLAGYALRDTQSNLSEAQVKQVDTESNAAFQSLLELINCVSQDGGKSSPLHEPLMKNLTDAVGKDKATAVWEALKNCDSVSDLTREVAELLKSSESGSAGKRDVFQTEKALLTLMSLASNQTEENAKPCHASARTSTESNIEKNYFTINKALGEYFLNLSGYKGKGASAVPYKIGAFFMRCSDPYRLSKVSRLIKTPEGRLLYSKHPTVMKDDPNAGRLSRGLLKSGMSLREFGRCYALSLDTNLAKFLRSCMIKGYEKCTGQHGSLMASHTAGMMLGWFTVGLALNLGAACLSGGFTAIPFIGELGFGLMSLTLWYALCMVPAALLMGAARLAAQAGF